MSDQFLAEVRIFPFSFPPTGWAYCNGQILPISQNTALFALLGVNYGGDGKSTFALPDLQASVPMQPGQGQGLSPRFVGETGGVEAVTLLESEIPVHAHQMHAADADATTGDATNQLPARGLWDAGTTFGVVGSYSGQGSYDTTMSAQALAPSGGSLPHNNMQPSLALNFCIALQGIFPQRP